MCDIHHVHVWSVGEHDNHMEAHVRVDDIQVSAADAIRMQAEQILHDKFKTGHVTLQVEHVSCSGVGLIKQQSNAQIRDDCGVTREEVEQAMGRINHRQRKTLGFRTPYEVFFSTHTYLTVALGS